MKSNSSSSGSRDIKTVSMEKKYTFNTDSENEENCISKTKTRVE